jgi:hypothetical protein
MEDRDYLNLGIGSGVVTVTVQDIQIKDAPINREGGTAKKVVLNCSDGSSEKLQVVDEAWVTYRGTFQNRGLWLSLDKAEEHVVPLSALGKVMKYNGATVLGDLKGCTIKGIHKQNGFLALLTEDYDDNTAYGGGRK